MKLYTETEILSLLKIHLADEEQADSFVALLTPIELPSDDEIDEKFEPRSTMYELGYRDGAKWLKNKIQGGNK